MPTPSSPRPGLAGYWRLHEPSGSTLTDASGNGRNGLYFNGPTPGQAGALATDADTSAKFNGTNQYAKVDLNLSATPVVTVECWFYWTANATDGRELLEFTSTRPQSTTGFSIVPNTNWTFFPVFAVLVRGDGGNNESDLTQPGTNAWHHLVVVFDKSQPAATEITPYVDGLPLVPGKKSSSENTNNFGNSTLYFMISAGTSAFAPANSRIDEVAVYTGALTPAQVQAHYQAATGT